MKQELFMRKEKGAIDLFAAFMNVNSMQATEQNFSVLRKEVDRAEKRIMKEVRMKRMKGVSVGRHPFFQKRGSFDGEKMVVALRIQFTSQGEEYYSDIAKFIAGLGFKEKAMALASKTARGTNNRGRIEEFDYDRSTTHLFMSDVVNGITENMEEVVKNRQMMARSSKKKPLNRDRRMKEVFKKDAPKRRGEMPPPTKKFKDKTKYDRKRQEKYSMDNDKIAAELVKLAKDLIARPEQELSVEAQRELKKFLKDVKVNFVADIFDYSLDTLARDWLEIKVKWATPEDGIELESSSETQKDVVPWKFFTKAIKYYYGSDIKKLRKLGVDIPIWEMLQMGIDKTKTPVGDRWVSGSGLHQDAPCYISVKINKFTAKGIDLIWYLEAINDGPLFEEWLDWQTEKYNG